MTRRPLLVPQTADNRRCSLDCTINKRTSSPVWQAIGYACRWARMAPNVALTSIQIREHFARLGEVWHLLSPGGGR